MAIDCKNYSTAETRLIGHVEIQVTTSREAVDRLRDAIVERRAGAWGFCNAHTVNIAETDTVFRTAIHQMTIFNDGIGVDIASKQIYGRGFIENLNGTDLTPKLLSVLPNGTKVYLVGGRADIVEAAAIELSLQHRNIQVCGASNGYFSEEDGKLVEQRIAASGAQLVLAGMGHPRQEVWAVKCSKQINAPILCVGALIDRLGGVVTRAPVWMRRANMEWLYRLILEPRRLAKRYLWGNAVFLIRAQRQKAAVRSGSPL